jgi:hypothetical protein
LDEILARYGDTVGWDETPASFDAEAEPEALPKKRPRR